MRFTLDFFPWSAILWPLTKQRTFYTNGQGSLRISPLDRGLTVYVNDMTEGGSSYISLFADDAKLLKIIRNHKDCKEL